jgi:hypothetical protein
VEIKRTSLNYPQSLQFFDFISPSIGSYLIDGNLLSNNNTLVRLPLSFKVSSIDGFSSSIQSANLKSLTVGFILAQAGSATVGLSINGTLTKTKVIKKYMVRKSQGKAQLSHLKTKGKSRLGSRIRLQQSVKFFEEINEKLTDFKIDETADLILYSCSKTLFPYVFSEPESVIKKHDDRLVKIPLDVDEPKLSVLQYINKYAHKTIIETSNPTIGDFIDTLKPAK